MPGKAYVRMFIAVLVALLAIGQTALAAPLAQDAPDANGPATIVTFSASLPFITITEAEATQTTVTLNWHSVGLNEDQRLILERWDLDHFASLLNADETSLPMAGTREVTISAPTSFAPPTFRLSVLDFRNRVIDQQTVTIPYVRPTGGQTEITTFVADVNSVDPAALSAGSARVTLTWQIADRPPTANPVFEQLLPDGTAVLVELPRSFVWIPSSGSGQVAPVLPEGATTITLRMRVVDLVDGTVYAENTLPISVGGAPVEDGAGGGQLPPAESTEDAPPPAESAQIVSFVAAPQSAVFGDTVTLTWEVIGATSVQIAVRTDLSTAQTVIASNLPVLAGLTIPLSETTFAGVSDLTFILRAIDAGGNVISQGRADVSLGPGSPLPEATVDEASAEG